VQAVNENFGKRERYYKTSYTQEPVKKIGMSTDISTPTPQTWNFKLISQLLDHNGDWNVVLNNKLLTRERSLK